MRRWATDRSAAFRVADHGRVTVNTAETAAREVNAIIVLPIATQHTV
jgi:hypothetical protein